MPVSQTECQFGMLSRKTGPATVSEQVLSMRSVSFKEGDGVETTLFAPLDPTYSPLDQFHLILGGFRR